ncbi:MAG: HD domain-containing phosphohydrolase [Butyrivibrio sp.]
MVTLFYFIVFLLSMVMVGSFLFRNKTVNSEIFLFAVLVMVNCFGRFFVAVSETLETAIWANRFIYVGACYTPLMTLFVLARLCNIRVPKVLKVIMALLSTVVMGLVLTIGKYPIYYKSVELIHGDGYNYLRKEYGPFHVLYAGLMIAYSIIMIYYLIYAVRKRRQVSLRMIVTITATEFAIVITYYVELLTRSNISYKSAGFLIAVILLIRYFEHINMYDMSANIVNSIERMKEYGYLVLDDKYRYMNANDYIKELFPEINDWIVDKEVPVSDSYLYCEIVQYAKNWDEQKDDKKIINVKGHYFQLEIRKLSYGRKKDTGYLLEFIDRTAEQKYYHAIEAYNKTLEKEVDEKTADVTHVKDMMVLGMADMVESRDHSTGGHIKRTSDVVKVFSDKLKHCECKYNLDEHFLQEVEKAAPMHDLGKIAIDDKILRKPGKYTLEEYAEMKRHPEEGAKIVENILRGVEEDEFVEIARNIAYYHHERWDGTGYPCGLANTQIPVEARIMALADVFDALVSKRCYKEAFSYDKAFEIIKESLGGQFDPELGRIFITCRPQLEALYNSYT